VWLRRATPALKYFADFVTLLQASAGENWKQTVEVLGQMVAELELLVAAETEQKWQETLHLLRIVRLKVV
jgi:hypothetical protein